MLQISLAWPECLFRYRELSLGVGAYITSDNALHAPKSGMAMHYSLELLRLASFYC